MSLYRWD